MAEKKSDARSKKQKKENYKRLKGKIFLIMGGSMVITALLLFFLYSFFLHGNISYAVIGLMQNIFRLQYSEALNIYNFIFRGNFGMWLFLGMLLLFLVVNWFILFTMVTRYFRMIDQGLEGMLSDDKKEIELPEELHTLEKKMNAAKRNLERRKMEAEMENVRKNDLITYLAHDLKTPLASVVGYLSLLHEAPDMPPEQRAKYVGIALDKANRLEELINEFFEITRFNIQTIILNKRRINLSYMLQQMADEFYPILEEQGKKAVVESQDGVIIYADADKIARVFNNILKNAIAYSERNSTIKVKVTDSEEKTWIQFINHGEPIPEHKLNAIFEKFYRLDSSRSSATGGAGLGLAIAKEIVTAHNGELLVTSSREQTVFTVILPK